MIQEIQYRDFITRYKLIRKDKDSHFGDILLMKDIISKQRVIVKCLKINNDQEILLNPIKQLSHLYKQQFFVSLLAYTIQNHKFIYLIYQNEQNNLEQRIKQMSLHDEQWTQQSLLLLIDSISKAIKYMQSHEIYHGDIKPSYIYQRCHNTLQHSFKLFYTNFVVSAGQQIRDLGLQCHPYVSPCIIDNIQQGNNLGECIHTDYYSLGLVILTLAGTKIKDPLNKRLRQCQIKFPKVSLLIQKLFQGGKNIKNKQFKRNNFHKQNNIQHLKRSDIRWSSGSKSRNKSIQKNTFKKQLKTIQQKILFDVHGREIENIVRKIYSDNSCYVGQIKGQTRHGKGIYYYSQGDVYAGQWYDNILQGKGIYLFENGQKYEGEVKGGTKNGKGIYYYLRGNIYDGQWIQDLKHGLGQYRYGSGHIYRGLFQKGKKHGQGTLSYPQGILIQGIWNNNMLSGPSIVHYNNLTSWQGNYLNNIRQPGGQFTFKGGKMINDHKNIIEWNTGDRYQGQIKQGLLYGLGHYYYNNGDQYHGKINKGKFNQQGILEWVGNKIEGKWNHHNLLMAKIELINGDQYIGQIRSNQFHGKGQYKWKNGYTFMGTFEQGVFKQGVLKTIEGQFVIEQ